MKKRIGLLLFAVIFTLNQLIPISTVNASENRSAETERIYVEMGEEEVDTGDGTADNPYKNIRNALEQIQSGQTLVLVGEVVYTKYDQETDGSAKPLFIDKNITITGDTPEASLRIRTAIQLSADVTFKDMGLQMVPENILGGSGSEGTLGTIVERSATIYADGHTLILDGVNTKLGTNADQDNTRPYISGGAYKGSDGVHGDHAVIKVINPTEQTKIASIYAGDYWRGAVMPVDIEIDAPLVDKTIHAAGVNGNSLEGNVNVTLGKKSNITSFDKADQLGELNVTFASNTICSELSFDQVDNLVLNEATRINIPNGGEFNVNNVTLQAGAIIDFRNMSVDPAVRGNLIGADNSTPNACGAILIKNGNTLKVTGNVSGLTRLNTNGVENVDSFVEGHSYVEASDTSLGGFTIEGSQHNGYVLETVSANGRTQWVVNKQQVSDDEAFDHFKWVGGTGSIPSFYQNEEIYFPVEFYNKNGDKYKPYLFDLTQEFELKLSRENGEEISDDDVYFNWDYNVPDEGDELHQILLISYVNDIEDENIILEVTHTESGTAIRRVISIGDAVHTCHVGDIQKGQAATCTKDGWNDYYVLVKLFCNTLFDKYLTVTSLHRC